MPPAAGPDRPNILLILSDEHTAAITGCYGDRLVRTPSLDRLAADGIAFDAAYTPSPLCVPARLAFTAGKYVSRVGAWSNQSRLPSDDMPTLPHRLNAAGYESLLCGKMHYDATRRYGFRDWGDVPYVNQARKTGRIRRRDADDESVDTGSRDRRFADFHTGESFVLEQDRAVTAGTVDFLRGRRRDDRPFFFLAGYLAPHFPLIVPEPYHRMYAGKVPMPHVPAAHLADQPRNYRHLRRGFGVVEVDPEKVRLGRELYYGMVTWLDEQIAAVLDALADSDVADNTVVIYTTDHGEDLGEHGLWWKNCMYECAARVPLIVSWPARWAGGQRRTEACSLLDLGRTLGELGKADLPADWNGQSLLGSLDEAGAGSRDLAVSEYYGHNICSGFAMIRRGRYKYVYHARPDQQHGPERELYDLRADPGELTNLAGRPDQADRLAALHADLVAEVGEEPDETERRCREDIARGYDRGDDARGPGEGGGKGARS
jgi:choline-sulfatase